METKTKILFVIAALRNGGAERVLQIVANDLAHDFSVSIAVLENDENHYEFTGINLIYLNVYESGSKFAKYKLLRECFKRENPNVIVSFMDWTNVACVIANFGLGIPLIATEHNSHEYLKNRFFAAIRDFCYSRADVLSVLTRADYEYYSRFVRYCVIIHNPFFGQTNANSSEKENVILSVGRLEKVKGYEIYFKALSKIDKKLLEKWQILIAGDGSQRDNLLNLASEFGLKINFLGHQKDVGKFYEKAKIFALSSFSEGLSNVLIEASFYDCARISSDTAGAKELIKNGENGILFKIGDENEFAAKLENLMRDEGLREKITHNAKVNSDEFRRENIIKMWRDLIGKIVGGRGKK